jgi:hypothetical protein
MFNPYGYNKSDVPIVILVYDSYHTAKRTTTRKLLRIYRPETNPSTVFIAVNYPKTKDLNENIIHTISI